MSHRKALSAAFVVVIGAAAWLLSGASSPAKNAKDTDHGSASRIRKGLQITPVPLNLEGKNRALVGMGSYLVNAVGGCNDCHSCPSYAPGHNPFGHLRRGGRVARTPRDPFTITERVTQSRFVPGPPTLSVVIPVYNEKGTIEELLRRVARVPIPKEVVLVDDASTDGTGERLASLVDRFAASGAAALGIEDPIATIVLHLHRQTPNQGKGAAVRAGFARTTGDVVIVQDADLEYDPADYPALVAPILEGRADVVYGSRLLGGRLQHGYTFNYFANRFLTFLSNRFTGLGLTDMETCYKVMRGPIARSLVLRADRFGFDPEITAKLARGRHRVVEVPIVYQGRSYAEGKKIRWQDGFVVIAAILRYAWRD